MAVPNWCLIRKLRSFKTIFIIKRSYLRWSSSVWAKQANNSYSQSSIIRARLLLMSHHSLSRTRLISATPTSKTYKRTPVALRLLIIKVHRIRSMNYCKKCRTCKFNYAARWFKCKKCLRQHLKRWNTKTSRCLHTSSSSSNDNRNYIQGWSHQFSLQSNLKRCPIPVYLILMLSKINKVKFKLRLLNLVLWSNQVDLTRTN